MATTTTATSTAARVEHLAQGPLPTSDVIYYPPNDPGPSGPPDPPELGIEIHQPATGPHNGTQSQGVVLVASGIITWFRYDIVGVSVKFPGTGFLPATRSSNGWSVTSPPITVAGPGTVIARVTATNEAGVNESRPVERDVDIVLTDDIPPTVTVSAPATLKPDSSSGQYVVPLTATADPNDVVLVEYHLGTGGWRSMPLKPSATTWATGPEATVPYSTEPWFVQAHVKDGAGHDGYAG
ncbi:MAG: hypothetical protein ACRCYQ_08435, partial [Nocardioides sp.]